MTHSDPSGPEAMEHIAPPPPSPSGPDDPRLATDDDVAGLARHLDSKSIAGAAALFKKECVGADSYQNNCAHYLSDAFLRAGYDELKSPAPCVNARCGSTAKRPVRARDMWCWFQAMATETSQKLPSGKGFWAVFQLDEAAYWGGHVVIVDTDANVAYGTDNFPTWTQHCYKW